MSNRGFMLCIRTNQTVGHCTTLRYPFTSIIHDLDEDLRRRAERDRPLAQPEKQIPVLPRRQMGIEGFRQQQAPVKHVSRDVNAAAVPEKVIGMVEANGGLQPPREGDLPSDDTTGERRPRTRSREEVVRVEERNEWGSRGDDTGALSRGHTSPTILPDAANPEVRRSSRHRVVGCAVIDDQDVDASASMRRGARQCAFQGAISDAERRHDDRQAGHPVERTLGTTDALKVRSIGR